MALRGRRTSAARAIPAARPPPLALTLIKRALDRSAGNDLDAQLDLERDLQRVAGASADYREGVTAFAGKRQPRFAGR